ncbi:hypothetical protein Ancab_025139 [Ancistrocladus abbreviatus]
MGPIAPALTARIPLDPRSQGCLVESGTGVGDPEGSALVGPLMIFPRPPQRLFARAAEGEGRVKNDVKGRRSGRDHTSTNAPDLIRTPQSSVLGREGGKCALTSQRGRRVGNEAGRRGNGPDRNGTNGPDPTRPLGQGCLVESGTGVGDPEGSALVGPLMIIPRPPQRLFARAAEGERRVKNDVKGGGVGAIIPALMHRIPSELRS